MKIKLFILLLLLSLLFSCHQQINDEWVIMNSDQKVDILLYFKKGISQDEKKYFLDNVASYQRKDGKGTEFLEGIQASFLVRTQDYEGYGILLRKNVTEDQRSYIVKTINNSSSIYKVFENVVPNKIVLDEAKAKKEKEDIEKMKNDNRPPKEIVIANSNGSK